MNEINRSYTYVMPRWGRMALVGSYAVLVAAGIGIIGITVLDMFGVRFEDSWSELTRVGMVVGAILVGMVLLAMTIHERRFIGRLRRGLCPGCGYDLRASTDRCPECGREIGSNS